MPIKKILLILLPVVFVILAFLTYLNARQTTQAAVCCATNDFSGMIDFDSETAIYEGTEIKIPQIAYKPPQTYVLGATSEEKWIEVDLSHQILRAWEGNKLYLETPISSGLPWFPTPQGDFRIWVKLRATKMEGGSGKYYYNLPNVPYVMFFEGPGVPRWKGYGLHGTYWHNDFGRPHSHGCVNLPTDMAEKLYYWANPSFQNSIYSVFSSDENPGTRINIHD